jgi:type II secretory pathway component HofQ
MLLALCAAFALSPAHAGGETLLIRLGGEVVENPTPLPASWNPLLVQNARQISMDVEHAKLRTVLRHIQDISNLNFVLMDQVDGEITVRVQRLPWNQVLDAVLETHGLVARPVAPDSTIILIGPRTELGC